ncbi:MAG: protein translocase SEC61 complex subunit gamma [Candidatus Aenigmarchaeota archaeon]|nr:protein translocase SEC61 complex subunit gamma [Candidatus Aenigmarchaeota archaeon]
MIIGFFTRIKEKLLEYRRVMEVATKPDKEEFVTSARVTTIGIAIIGFMGFALFLLFQFGISKVLGV